MCTYIVKRKYIRNIKAYDKPNWPYLTVRTKKRKNEKIELDHERIIGAFLYFIYRKLTPKMSTVLVTSTSCIKAEFARKTPFKYLLFLEDKIKKWVKVQYPRFNS